MKLSLNNFLSRIKSILLFLFLLYFFYKLIELSINNNLNLEWVIIWWIITILWTLIVLNYKLKKDYFFYMQEKAEETIWYLNKYCYLIYKYHNECVNLKQSINVSNPAIEKLSEEKTEILFKAETNINIYFPEVFELFQKINELEIEQIACTCLFDETKKSDYDKELINFQAKYSSIINEIIDKVKHKVNNYNIF